MIAPAVPSYPADLVIVPRGPRRYRLVIGLLLVAALALLALNVRPTAAPKPTPRPTPVAHVVPRPAAPRLSASIAGRTYACTVVPPKSPKR